MDTRVGQGVTVEVEGELVVFAAAHEGSKANPKKARISSRTNRGSIYPIEITFEQSNVKEFRQKLLNYCFLIA